VIKLKEADLLLCCGSAGWARQMAAHSFPNVKELLATGDSIWWSLDPSDWKQAFAAHSKINTNGSEHALEELRALKREYEQRFGYCFVLSAAGRQAHSIVETLRTRIHHDPDTEIRVAAEEERQNTHSRLKRLLGPYKG
jgi:hypothetical protein